MQIIFICTGNAARSQMAKGWTRHLTPAAVVESASTRPARLSRRAVAVMVEAGVDISAHRSKPLSVTAWHDADIAVTFCGDTPRALADRELGSGASRRRPAGVVPHSAGRNPGAGGSAARQY